MMQEHEIIERIKEFFEDNFERMKLEDGRTITEDAKQLALNQVLFYYQKLKHIATQVTHTEVRLTLPNQTTSKGRNFTIEGIVDIVKEHDETWMYDIKTHDPEYINANKDKYLDQLNVYAHIWQELRGQQLDKTAVISTAYPINLKGAILSGDLFRIQHELAKWDPVIPIEFDQERITKTISDLATVVDEIEDKNFKAPMVETLQAQLEGSHSQFATRICRNCDARFSCPSYREYALTKGRGERGSFKKYFEDYGPDADQEEWVNANLQNTNDSAFDGER